MKTELHSGICELCTRKTDPENLYVDLFNQSFILVCPKCFYSRYQDKDKDYFQKVYQVLPDVLSYKTFKQHNKDKTVIANTYPYFKHEGIFLTEKERSDLIKSTTDRFYSLEKINRKFKVVKTGVKTSEQVNPEGVLFLVALVAWVKFNTYLEFLEHEMFKKFRRDCPTILR